MKRNLKHGEYRGVALVLCFENFLKLNQLSGTKVDVGNLERVLESKLNYSVYTFNDLNKRQVDDKIREFSNQDYTDADSFLCVVSSHGNHEREIYTSDDSTFSLDMLYKSFQENESLFGKPKLFIIDACRGPLTLDVLKKLLKEKDINEIKYENSKEFFEQSDCIEDDISNLTAQELKIKENVNTFSESKSVLSQIEENKISFQLNKQADVLKFYSSTFGYISHISHVEGSRLINAFCNVVNIYGTSVTLESICVKANKLVMQKYPDQVCIYNSTLRNILFFGDVLNIENELDLKD